MDEQSRRKFLKQFAVLSVGASTVILAGCDIILPKDESHPLYGPPTPEIEVDPPDETGNIFILNKIGVELVLYDRYRRLKVLPQNSTFYRVNVLRKIPVESELEVCIYYDVASSIDDPSTAYIYQKWLIDLPMESTEYPDYIWVIDDSNAKESGELILNYHPNSEKVLPEINVDVILIREETKHIETIEGGRPKHLGLAFGEYTLEFTYWRNDPVNADGRIELGRINTEIVDGGEVPIRVILDAEHKKIERTIPNWEG